MFVFMIGRTIKNVFLVASYCLAPLLKSLQILSYLKHLPLSWMIFFIGIYIYRVNINIYFKLLLWAFFYLDAILTNYIQLFRVQGYSFLKGLVLSHQILPPHKKIGIVHLVWNLSLLNMKKLCSKHLKLFQNLGIYCCFNS